MDDPNVKSNGGGVDRDGGAETDWLLGLGVGIQRLTEAILTLNATLVTVSEMNAQISQQRGLTRERVRKHRARRRTCNVTVTLQPELPEVGDPDSLSVEGWFEECVWPLYPRKEAKLKALKALKAAFRAIPKSREDELGEQILAGLERAKPIWANRDREFTPLAASWVNARRWEDELA